MSDANVASQADNMLWHYLTLIVKDNNRTITKNNNRFIIYNLYIYRIYNKLFSKTI